MVDPIADKVDKWTDGYMYPVVGHGLYDVNFITTYEDSVQAEIIVWSKIITKMLHERDHNPGRRLHP